MARSIDLNEKILVSLKDETLNALSDILDAQGVELADDELSALTEKMAKAMMSRFAEILDENRIGIHQLSEGEVLQSAHARNAQQRIQQSVQSRSAIYTTYGTNTQTTSFSPPVYSSASSISAAYQKLNDMEEARLHALNNAYQGIEAQRKPKAKPSV